MKTYDASKNETFQMRATLYGLLVTTLGMLCCQLENDRKISLSIL